LVLTSPQAPTTNASEDGMHITYCGKTFLLENFRNGIEHSFTEAEAEMNDLLSGKDYGLTLPDHCGDNWPEVERGYSWMSTGTFGLEKDCVLKKYFKRYEFYSADLMGTLIPQTPFLWELLKKLCCLLKLLVFLCYFTPGGVVRVSEF